MFSASRAGIRRRSVLSFVTMLVPLIYLSATAKADQITLKNGDRVTGKIIKKDGASVTVKSDLFGAVVIPWDAVTEISSDESINIVLADGRSIEGRLATRGDAIEVTTGTSKETLSKPDISALRNADEQRAYERLQRPGWVDLWVGYVDLGISLARGNAETTTFSTAMGAARITKGDKTSVYFRQIYSKGKIDGVDSTTANAVRGGWAYDKNFSPRWFVNLFNDYEFDGFQNLDLRFVLGGGVGYTAIKNERTRLAFVGGAAYNREKFDTGLTRNSAEVYWGDDWNKKLFKGTAINQSFRMFHNLANTADYRINFDLGTVTTLNKWLSWQMSLSDRYLSNPVPGNKKNDTLFTTGLRVSFAR
jgi:Protein of unknown function, DUF481